MNYELLSQQLKSLTEGIPYPIANLSNASALLWQNLEAINWAGFYKLTEDGLVLYPFQGKPACIQIPLGRGVCGTAAVQERTQLVPDVHAFPGHIACDADSQSEIVVPIYTKGKLWGVLDIDSPVPGRFTYADQLGLEQFARTMGEILENSGVTY